MQTAPTLRVPRASLIFTTGVASEMLLPRSSRIRFTSSSSSVTRPSSPVSSLDCLAALAVALLDLCEPLSDEAGTP